MTPKEKAIELVEKMKPYSHFWVHDLGSQKDYDIEQLENAKQCAIIAVDEMINLLMTMNKYMMFPEQVEYLQKVKKEIEKL